MISVDHTAISVIDHDETLRFYRENFGFTTEFEYDLSAHAPGARGAMLELEGNRLEVVSGLVRALPEAPGSIEEHFARGGYVHFALRVQDLDQTLDDLRQNGVQVLATPFDPHTGQGRLAMVLDNSGNVIELVEATGL